MNEEQELQRGLKNRHVQLISIGGAIERGCFRLRKVYPASWPFDIARLSHHWMYLFFIMRALGELLLSNTNNHSFLDFVAEYLGKKRLSSLVGRIGSAGYRLQWQI